MLKTATFILFCSSSVKELEEPDVLVKLLSIAGSNSIYCHQWKEGAQKGIDKFKTLLKGKEWKYEHTFMQFL